MSEDTFRRNQSPVIQVYLINSFVPIIAGNYYNFDGVSIRTSLETISLRHVQPSNAKLTYMNGLRSNPCDVRQRSINFIIYRRFVSKLITLEINLLHFETSIPLALKATVKFITKLILLEISFNHLGRLSLTKDSSPMVIVLNLFNQVSAEMNVKFSSHIVSLRESGSTWLTFEIISKIL
ncbi:MAG: hypothetical protein ACTS6A_01690 [Candidatus Hodgkinia cicadicola]